MNVQVFHPRESLHAPFPIALERSFIRVESHDVLVQLIFLIISFMADFAAVFSSYVRIVHVIKNITFHPKSHAADVALEFLKITLWRRVNNVLFFVVL